MAEKFTFTEELYSYVMLLPRSKRRNCYKKIVEFGLFQIEPKIKKSEQAIWNNIKRLITEEREKRYIRQVNGQRGGRKNIKKQPETEPKKVIKVSLSKNNQNQSKKNLEVSKNKPSQLDVSLFCIANGVSLSDSELNLVYKNVIIPNLNDWRNELKKYLVNNF